MKAKIVDWDDEYANEPVVSRADTDYPHHIRLEQHTCPTSILLLVRMTGEDRSE
jgi:hypothetical protein